MCYFDNWGNQGEVLCNHAVLSCWALFNSKHYTSYDCHYPWCLKTVLKSICSMLYLTNWSYGKSVIFHFLSSLFCNKIKWQHWAVQSHPVVIVCFSFDWSQLNSCKKHTNFSWQMHSFLEVKMWHSLKENWKKNSELSSFVFISAADLRAPTVPWWLQ